MAEIVDYPNSINPLTLGSLGFSISNEAETESTLDMTVQIVTATATEG